MQIRSDQLRNHLKSSLHSFYWISGDDAFLMNEACDILRKTANQQGFLERLVFDQSAHLSFDTLKISLENFSLFSNKQIIEIRLTTAVPELLIQLLKSFVNSTVTDKLILLVTKKLETSVQQTVWFKTLLQKCVFIPIKELEREAFGYWLKQRIAKTQLTLDAESFTLLQQTTEGNLLAAAQEIEKLRLLFPNERITKQTLSEAISENTRFNLFRLSDAALAGESTRCARILKRFKEEGMETLLILWALVRELRLLTRLSFYIQCGDNFDNFFSTQRIWEKKQAELKKACVRHSYGEWSRAFSLAANIDRIIKGIEKGEAWNELHRLTYFIAGEKNLC